MRSVCHSQGALVRHTDTDCPDADALTSFVKAFRGLERQSIAWTQLLIAELMYTENTYQELCHIAR